MTTKTKTKLKLKNKKYIEDICDEMGWTYVYMTIELNKTKNNHPSGFDKKAYNMPDGWKEMTMEEIRTPFTYINKKTGKKGYYNHDSRKLKKRTYNSICINCNASNLVIVDVDKQSAIHRSFIEFGKNNYTLSNRNNMPHFYFNKHPDDKHTTKTDLKDKVGYDLIYQTLFETRNTTLKYYTGSIDTFNNYQKYHNLIKEVAEEYSESEESEESEEEEEEVEQVEVAPSQEEAPDDIFNNELRDIVDNIAPKYAIERDWWLRIVWGIYNSTKDIELCDRFSKRGGDKYKGKDDVIKTIKTQSKRDDNKLCSFGTVAYYSKLSNSQKYYDIREYYSRNLEYTDFNLAQTYLDVIGDNLINDKSGLYIWNDNSTIWTLNHPYDNGNLIVSINKNLTKIFETRQTKLKLELKKCLGANLEEKKKAVETCAKSLKKVNMWANLTTIAKAVVWKINGDIKDYKMNEHRPELFVFKNCCINLKTGKEETSSKYDYISIDCGYDYYKSNDKDKEEIRALLKTIQPIDEHYKTLLSILKQMCWGEQSPYFVYFNGSGSNGKGVVLDNMQIVLGNYGTTTQTSFLTEKIKTSNNTTFYDMHTRRAIIYSEPEKNEKINAGNMKKLSDNKYHKTRGNYMSVDVRILLCCLNVIECNIKPRISGDQALYCNVRRIIDLLFSNRFTMNKEDIDVENGVYQANPLYKNSMWMEKMKCAWFDVICEDGGDDGKMYIAEAVKNRSKEFLMNSDDLYNWFNETYEEDPVEQEKKTIIPLKKIYEDEFRGSEFYQSLTLKERDAEWKFKHFKNKITQNLFLSKIFKPRIKRDNVEYTNVFVGYKLKSI